MLQKTFAFAIFLSLNYSLALAQYTGDPRLAPISAQELRKSIKETPIKSPRHFELISRAYNAKLSKEAYESYALRWKKSPNDANTNLLVGIAAQRYEKQLMSPFSAPKSLREQVNRSNALHRISRERLANAVKLNPASATANVAYGFFLWQIGNQQEKGLALVKKGIALSSKSAGAHATLGAIYANSSGKAYDPVKAEAELRTAILLDKKFAYPHEALAWLYVNLKRYKDAQKSFDNLLKLSPETMVKKQHIQMLQSLINKGLNSR
jgi:tetratricopeptide (TPR) repeat protein